MDLHIVGFCFFMGIVDNQTIRYRITPALVLDWAYLSILNSPFKYPTMLQSLICPPISECMKPLCVCVCSHLQVPDELSHGDLLCHPMVEAVAVEDHALEDG